MKHSWKSILVENREGKSPLGRIRRRGEDNIRMHLREIGWEVVNWINMTKERNQWRILVKAVVNIRVT
jgi:hypothetical protein